MHDYSNYMTRHILLAFRSTLSVVYLERTAKTKIIFFTGECRERGGGAGPPADPELVLGAAAVQRPAPVLRRRAGRPALPAVSPAAGRELHGQYR